MEKNFKFQEADKKKPDGHMFVFKNGDGEDHRIVKHVPEIFANFVQEGDMLWHVKYRHKNRLWGRMTAKKKDENLLVFPTNKKRDAKSTGWKDWYTEMVSIHKAGRLHKLVFIRGDFKQFEMAANSSIPLIEGTIPYTHIHKDKEFEFLVRKGKKENSDLRRISSVKTGGSATGEVQVHDIIRSFQLGSETPIDVETTPKTQNEWWNEMIKLREKCSQSKPLTITFFRGLKIGPVSNEKEFVFKLAGQKGEDAMGFVQCKKSPTIIGVGKGGLAETLGVRADDVILGFRIKDEDWVDTHQKHWRTKFDEYRTKAINDVRNGGEFTMKIRDTKDLLRTPKRRRLSQLDRLVRELQLASSME